MQNSGYTIMNIYIRKLEKNYIQLTVSTPFFGINAISFR